MVSVAPLVAVYVTIASVLPTLLSSEVTVSDAVAAVRLAGAAGPVTVVAAVTSVAPILILTVVAALNVEVTKYLKYVICAPAGITNAVPVSDPLIELKSRVTVCLTTAAPILRMVPAVVPVVSLTVPKSQGPR